MQLNFVYDPSVANAPAGFKSALAVAAGYFDGLITNNITVTITVGWGEDNGQAVTGNTIAEGGPNYTTETYAQVVAGLTRAATSVDDLSAVAHLPAIDPFPSNSFAVSLAEQEAWGQVSANSPRTDGAIGFNSADTYTFDPNNRSVAGAYDFIGVAEHEIAHALGRFSSDDANPAGMYTPMDLFKYTSPGVLAQIPSTPSYFSVDGGTIALSPFDASSSGDPGDWAASVTGDSFQSYNAAGTTNVVTPTDIRLLDVLGYMTTAPTTAASTAFQISDTTTGTVQQAAGQAYNGPVAGLTSEFISPTNDALNVTAEIPDVFIHTGSGADAIDVSKVNGNNVIDGGGGSNFLVGGTGDDTFFVDDRAPTANIWSTVANFHAGDTATVFGVTAAGFDLNWVDGQGAVGFTGLTLHVSASGQPTASLTLAGYSSADLLDGKLTINFGTEADGSGSYMTVIAA